MDKKRILQDIQNDLKAAKTAKNLVEQNISRWKRTYDGKPYGNEQKHRSSIVMKDVQKHVESIRPSIVEPFLGSDTLIKAKATNATSITSASASQAILNYQFNNQFDKLSFIDTISQVLPKEGTVFIRTGWERQENKKTKKLQNMSEEQLMAAQQMGELKSVEQNKDKTYNATLVIKKLVCNKPTAVVCRNEDIFSDPTAHGDVEKAKFVMHEYEVSVSDIYKNDILYPDRDELPKLMSHITDNSPDSVLGSERYANTQNLGTDASFVFSADAMKKVKLVEYWGEAVIDDSNIAQQVVCVFVKGTSIILRLEPNPYPDNAIPFVSAPYSREAFTTWGKALADPLEDNQKIRTAIMRGMIDNLALSNNGQKFFQKGSIDYGNMKKLASGYRFIEMNSIDGMKDGGYNEFPQSAYNMYNMVEAESESLSGVNKNMNGLDSATVGRTASGVNMVMSAAQRRTLMTVRNISNMLRKLFTKWAKYNEEFLDDGTIFDINGEFLQINRQDISGDHDYEIQIGMDSQNQGKMQQINMLMQQLHADGESGVDQAIRKELVAEFFDSMGKNEMAEKIRKEPPPKPDPMQQQMMQLEMREKEVAIMEKEASAKLKLAQAEKALKEAMEDGMSQEEKILDMQIKEAQARQKTENDAGSHMMKMRQQDENHRLKMMQQAEMHSKKMEQAATASSK